MIKLLFTKIQHTRFVPKRHSFAYRVFYVAYPVEDAPVPTPRFFSLNAFNVLGLSTYDYGAKDGTSWRVWIERECAKHEVMVSHDDRVLLMALPRVFGYVFSPIAFWLVFEGQSDQLKAVLCEVHNTFGDDHNYLLVAEDGDPIVAADTFVARKAMYVSPFNKVTGGEYHFQFDYSPERFNVAIAYHQDQVHTMQVLLNSTSRPMTSWRVLLSVITHPLMTLFIVARIYWQALRLYLKGVPSTLADKPGTQRGGTTHGSRV